MVVHVYFGVVVFSVHMPSSGIAGNSAFKWEYLSFSPLPLTSLFSAICSEVKVIQSFLTLCNPMGYTVHGVLQARILDWVAFPFSRGFSQPRDQIQVSHIAGGFFTSWATREVLFVRPPQTTILPFLHLFSWGWSWSLPPVQCHKPLSIVLQGLYLSDMFPWIYLSLPLYNCKGFNFMLFMGFSKEEYWSGLPFPSPVDHILSDLSTMTRPSWMVPHGMVSFIELDKAVVHVIRLASCLWLWFPSVCPLIPSLSAYHLTWVSLSLDVG